MAHLFNLFLVPGNKYLESLDADFNADGPFVSITESAIRFRRFARRQKISRQLVGCRKNLSRAAYLAQDAEALSGRSASTIKANKDL